MEDQDISIQLRRRISCFNDIITKLEKGEEEPTISPKFMKWKEYQIVLTAFLIYTCNNEKNSYFDPEKHEEIMKIYGQRLYKWYNDFRENLK